MNGKRIEKLREKVDREKQYGLVEAIDLILQCKSVNFIETFEMSLKIGVDPKKMMVRGTCVLENGTGKTPKIAVFTTGKNVDLATKAGADIVGLNDLADEIKAGNCDYDVVIASPDAMSTVGKLGKILGPKNLMPNPKVGTVTPDVAGAVENARKGQVMFKIDKGAIIHCLVGKVNFTIEQIKGNINQVISEVKRLKPKEAKGIYLQKLSISSTMGPSVRVDMSSL